MTAKTLPEWPPKLTQAQHDHVLLLAISYALSHGLTLLPPGNPTPTPPTHSITAPISLFPTPFPAQLYHLACELQPVYNALYARIALDWQFLDRVFEGTSKVDAFQGELWRGWKQVRDGLVQVSPEAAAQQGAVHLTCTAAAIGYLPVRLPPA